jgi:glycosyltransferase involved in cell wall biosynthesis
MIDSTLSERILLVGPDCESPKGGIGMVTKNYRQIFPTFNYLTTQVEGSTLLKIFVFAKAILQLIPFLVGSQIQIVHVHGSSNGSFIRKSLVILLSKLAGKKVIYHLHSGGFKDFTAKHPRAVNYILKKSDYVIGLSDYWKDYFEHDLHCKRVGVIHNIMDRPKEDHSVRQKQLCTFLFLGKICDHKGVFDLLDVINTHSSFFRGRMQLLLAGNGETERLKLYIKNHQLEDIVHFAGWVNGEEKCRLLNQSDVVVLPSYYEGVPICLLEGFSYHLPAISTCVGGIPEILEDGKNGIMIQPGDKKALYTALKRMIESPQERLEMGNQAYLQSINHLPEKVENSLEHIYYQLINKE